MVCYACGFWDAIAILVLTAVAFYSTFRAVRAYLYDTLRLTPALDQEKET